MSCGETQGARACLCDLGLSTKALSIQSWGLYQNTLPHPHHHLKVLKWDMTLRGAEPESNHSRSSKRVSCIPDLPFLSSIM